MPLTRRTVARMLASAAVVPGLAGTRGAPSSFGLFWYARRVRGASRELGSETRHRLPAASLIKLLIAYVLVEESSRDALAWDDVLRIDSRDVVDGSPTFGRSGGRAASLDALMFAMLSQSDNTAANALLGHVGYARCNAAARQRKMDQTMVERRFYDWTAERRGFENWSSPRDLGDLLVWFVLTAGAAGEPASDGASRVMRALYAQDDRETIPAALPGRRIANKTGELPGYRHDAAVIGSGARQYVLVAMTRFDGARAPAVAAIRALAREVDARESSALLPA
jgi:beta-lactamase class A